MCFVVFVVVVVVVVFFVVVVYLFVFISRRWSRFFNLLPHLCDTSRYITTSLQ